MEQAWNLKAEGSNFHPAVNDSELNVGRHIFPNENFI
jgi:hypothetical protein